MGVADIEVIDSGVRGERWLVRVAPLGYGGSLTGRKLRGGRQTGQECDGTGRCERSRGVAAVGGGEG